MKPIHLSIAGLHSFREKQEVDFRALCEGGVFGIFGPTGSGKSSILDAMTLALYGKVERASNQTQGIMNHAENELSVSFTFELLHSSGTKSYTVERSFKRADEIRLRAGSCRLIEKGEESFVLADKTGEVNQKIQELLGLTIEDFTRAVVLPQGKFAEFLSLKGVDRRQMLQRLFHLEQYGDDLNKKVKARLQEANQKVNEIVAEQAGLGDASREAIETVTKEANELEILLEKRKKELHEVEGLFEKQTKLWQLEQEKVKLTRKLKDLQLREESMNELAKQISLSDIATQLLPYAEELTQTEQRYQVTEEKISNLEKTLQDSKSNYQFAEEAYRAAQQTRLQEEPALLSQKEKLTGAKELISSKVQLDKERKDLQKQLALITEELHHNQKLLTENKSLLERGQARQKELKQQLADVTISSSMREQFQRARDQYRNLAFIVEQVEETKKLFKERTSQFTHTQAQIQAHQKQVKAQHTRLLDSFKQVERMYEQVCGQERKLEYTKLYIENAVERLRVEHEQIREAKLAELLAQRLKDGEPCPVCGSIEHSREHVTSTEEDSNIDGQISKWKESLASLQQTNPQIISLKLSLEQLAEVLINEGISSTPISVPLVSAKDEAMIQAEDIVTLLTEVKAINQDYIHQKELVHKELTHKKQLQQTISEQMQIIKLQTEELDQLETKVKKWQDDEQAVREKWQTEFPTFNLDGFEGHVSQMTEKDRQAQEISERIEKSIPFLEEKEKLVTDAKDQLFGLEKKQIEGTGQLQYRTERINELEKQIKEITNDEDVESLLHHIEIKLKQLYNKEKEAFTTYEETGRTIQRVEGELTSNHQLLQDLKALLEVAKEKWQQKSKDSMFTGLSDLQKSILLPDESKKLKETLQVYLDEEKQTNHDLNKLKEQLGDELITEEMWEQSKALFLEMKELLQELVEQKGSVNQTLLLLKEKHERYMELEKVRIELSQEVEQLGKLQQVLKGNSFVEFLAEEQLVRVARDASERLGLLTRQRYAIEVDSAGGFIMRDDANGGVRRPVNTLSGGETFLTSLALALALSAQIQLRGEYPLQFFFLDEGFGTLDGDLLDTVITALEKLHTNNLSVGVISHVHELRLRLPKKLVVEPAEPSGKGTRVKLELL
ncbi:AAA family ATPase [Bacillus pinisoli]|uniref:AAA family ATPase n=1 Tax=Bacillus pinisoli TaxID=2901866 RepID=UPI001FF31A00|nr:AAA family ATPase [Bacillus pinisoli]